MASNFLDSTIAQILEDIISQISFEGESHSNIADILLSILNQTPYEEEPKSVIADLFLKLKAKIEGEPFDPNDKEYLSTIGEILVSILEETEYDREPQSRIAELLLELKAELESFIEITVSGSVVSFTTKVSKPLVNLTADINPTETGTGAKSPSNPYVIGGHTECNLTHLGANLWDEELELGYIDNSGNLVPSTNRFRCKTPIRVIPNKTYYVYSGSNMYIYMFFYDVNGNFIRNNNRRNETIIIPANASTLRFCVGSEYGATYNNDISINSDPTDTAYHAYNGQTHTADFGQTVYGGSLNVTTGVLTIDRKYKKATDMVWVGYSYNQVYSATDTDNSVTIDYPTGRRPIICNRYDYDDSVNIIPNKRCGWGGATNNKNLFVRDSDNASSLAVWTAYIADNDVEFVYYIVPFTIQLDPIEVKTLLGANNIYHDCNGDTTVTYLDKRF